MGKSEEQSVGTNTPGTAKQVAPTGARELGAGDIRSTYKGT